MVYSAAVPSEPLLPLGDMQAGLIRFSFCRLKKDKIDIGQGTHYNNRLEKHVISLQFVINFV